MRFKISQMSALALLEHSSLDNELTEQIRNAPAKADTLYLQAPIESPQKARDELISYMSSNTGYNNEAYKLILSEVEELADNT